MEGVTKMSEEGDATWEVRAALAVEVVLPVDRVPGRLREGRLREAGVLQRAPDEVPELPMLPIEEVVYPR